MGKLYAKYPDDVDAGAFYALSLLAAKSPTDMTQVQDREGDGGVEAAVCEGSG